MAEKTYFWIKFKQIFNRSIKIKTPMNIASESLFKVVKV